MKVIPGLDGWPEGYEYSVAGRSVRFSEEPVAGVRPILHVRMFHPTNDHYGLSPIEAAATAIDIHNERSLDCAPPARRAGTRRCSTTRRGPRARWSMALADH